MREEFSLLHQSIGCVKCLSVNSKCKKLISNMQLFFYTLLITTLALAVPPPRPQPQRYTTLARQQSPPPAPYNPSGWRPQGERLVLPSRQTAPAAPSPSYGPPPQVYGPPRDVYGPPTTTEVATTTDIDFTVAPDVESFKVRPLQSQTQTTAENVERGQYYLLLPDGRLQKVQYVTSADLQRMAYSAKLRYEDVEPISGPIFTAANNQPFIPAFQKK